MPDGCIASVYRYEKPRGVTSISLSTCGKIEGRCVAPLGGLSVQFDFSISYREVVDMAGDKCAAMFSFGLKRLRRYSNVFWIDIYESAQRVGKTIPDHISEDLLDTFPIRILYARDKDLYLMVFSDPQCTKFNSDVPVEVVSGPLRSRKLLDTLSTPRG